MKKLFALWLTLLLSLSLTACGGSGSTDPDDVAGDDWRVTGVVRDTGTITRNGGDVDVLVCINADSADFYYDDATPVMYDYAAYPIALQCDPWEAFRSIDFADRNGDGNSDVALLFELDGAWYMDGDEDAETVIGIGAADDWILYDNSDGTLREVDSGTLRLVDEAQGHYAADSEVFSDVSYRVALAGDNAFYWGVEGDYHLFERLNRW